MSAGELARQIRAGERRALDVVTDCLQRQRAHDGQFGAFVEMFAAASAAAEAVDRARARGETLPPLAGVPVAIKDNLLCQGQRCSAGSRLLQEFVAPRSSTVVERLQAAGAILLGRTNMDEFGMGSSTELSAHGPSRNPWDRTRVPGGSSGGSAAAVAAGFVPLALGSDTGGSIRQPAAHCGVSGLKPTYGRISRFGLIAYASSLDCIGGLAASAEDLALLLDALAGVDPADSTSLAAEVPDHAAALAQRTDLRGLRLGLPAEMNGPGLDPEVENLVADAVAQLQDLGASIVPVELPTVAHAIPTYYLIAAAEASSNLARYDGIRFGKRRDGTGRLESLYTATRSHGFGDEVQLRILLGTFALRAGYQDEFYGQATRVRTLLRRDFERAFAHCDLLLSPTAPGPAPLLQSQLDDPLTMYVSDALTVPASLAGVPALSIPCGFTPQGLPVGLQWMAPPLGEVLLLQAGHVYQQHTDWHRRRPKL